MDNYLNFWNLNQPVFHPWPSNRPPVDRAEFQNLLVRLRQLQFGGVQIATITGEPGSGKSFAVKHAVKSLIQEFVTIHIELRTLQASPNWLRDLLIEKLALPTESSWSYVFQRLPGSVDKSPILIAIDQVEFISSQFSFEIETLCRLASDQPLVVILSGNQPIDNAYINQSTVYEWQCPNFHLQSAKHFVEKSLGLAGLFFSTIPEDVIQVAVRHSLGNARKLSIALERCMMEAAFEGRSHLSAEFVSQVLKHTHTKENAKETRPSNLKSLYYSPDNPNPDRTVIIKKV